MKRLFVFAFLAGLSAPPLGTLRAEDPANLGGALQPGEQQPNIVKPDAPRGQLGGLASGAPTFSANLQDLKPGDPAQTAVAPSPAAVQGAPAAGGAVSATTSTTVVQNQSVAPAINHRQVRLAIHQCLRAHLVSLGIPHEFLPIPLGVGFVPIVPHGAPSIGDMELTGIGMISDGNGEQGPMYRVSFQNHGVIPSRHFRVSLIAVQGEMNDASPVVTVKIDHIAGGASGHVDVQMPASVMMLGPKDHPVPFEKVVAVVDSFDELLEDSELNNVAIYTRGDIEIVETTTTAAAAPAAGAVAPAPSTGPTGPTGPAGPAAGAPAPQAAPPAAGGAPAPQAAPPAPGPGAAPGGAPAGGPQAPATENAAPGAQTPQDSVLDQLDLEKADGTSELFTQ